MGASNHCKLNEVTLKASRCQRVFCSACTHNHNEDDASIASKEQVQTTYNSKFQLPDLPSIETAAADFPAILFIFESSSFQRCYTKADSDGFADAAMSFT